MMLHAVALTSKLNERNVCGTSAVAASVNGANRVWPVVVFGNALATDATALTTTAASSDECRPPTIMLLIDDMQLCTFET